MAKQKKQKRQDIDTSLHQASKQSFGRRVRSDPTPLLKSKEPTMKQQGMMPRETPLGMTDNLMHRSEEASRVPALHALSYSLAEIDSSCTAQS